MQYFYGILLVLTLGDDLMKKRVTFTLSEELIEQLKKVSEETMIPQARLVEQALQDVVKKYG
jgi:predicted transcriptional regulator